MVKYRTVVAYKHYFEEFLDAQTPRVQAKILQIMRIIEEIKIIPENHLKYIEGTDGLFEIRVIFASNLFRVFCFFDEGRIVVLLSGFQKKTQKTPKKEIYKAVKLMDEYYKEKEDNI